MPFFKPYITLEKFLKNPISLTYLLTFASKAKKIFASHKTLYSNLKFCYYCHIQKAYI